MYGFYSMAYNFTILCRMINGTTYYGIVKGKEEAQREFEQRQQAGENVGLVESRYIKMWLKS